ncbi:hypothetical protein TSTA_008470 [Talaromyces stipitatus ATCC 10500]|uniref:Reverse transcriptase Ty1/copia-type domain-containing protein n=1 Tax=Talaromyces stipitatus (strain ATCC 10500 / CBS 375.48 / QM 6759 / NRRL 1006) TaxID=441959 RepID=B8MV95_TALSN|nr:uncharacterized protein TSTA_008470 [Talaromyces stipitatus ATCC 10500]EED11551.1 hypothetical protein TSTA_008470 [Talaromyces stipitatus ATCC 10500]
MSFHSSRHKHNTWSGKRGSLADSLRWHLRLGHPGPQAINHLVLNGVRLRGPLTQKCEACAQVKAKGIIQRFSRDIIKAAGAQLSVDFHDYEESSIDNLKTLMLVTSDIQDYYGIITFQIIKMGPFSPHSSTCLGCWKDVTFNEDETFDGNLDRLRDDLRTVNLEELAKLLQDVDVSEEEVIRSRPEARDLLSTVVNELINVRNILTQDEALGRVPNRGFGRVMTTYGAQEVDKEEATAHWQGYLTPPPTPPAALLAASIQRPIDEAPMPIKEYESFAPWKATFIAGSRYKPIGTFEGKTLERERILRNQSVNRIQDKKESDRSKLQKLIKQEQLHKIHRRDLPDPPKWHRDLETHPLGEQFAQAERAHLQSHIPMNSWTTTDRSIAKGSQILDCMWVYVYKFNKHGYLVKCKARLVVRGDQERRVNLENTYVATLAARSFRTFMAVAARFDLGIKQYDAVNAFVHALLD